MVTPVTHEKMDDGRAESLQTYACHLVNEPTQAVTHAPFTDASTKMKLCHPKPQSDPLSLIQRPPACTLGHALIHTPPYLFQLRHLPPQEGHNPGCQTGERRSHPPWSAPRCAARSEHVHRRTCVPMLVKAERGVRSRLHSLQMIWDVLMLLRSQAHLSTSDAIFTKSQSPTPWQNWHTEIANTLESHLPAFNSALNN